MASNQWKHVERIVAEIVGGRRTWTTEHDVMVVTDAKGLDEKLLAGATGDTLMTFAKMGLIEVTSVECKNLTGPSVAQLEAYLAKNRYKADRDGIQGSALVIKRKGGRGMPTPYLLVMPLAYVPSDITLAMTDV